MSTAGLVVGVAGATDDRGTLLTAGLAGLLAGSLSMAAGEYVSVSTQRDSEKAALAQEKRELATEPQAELIELTEMLEGKGLGADLAREVAEQLTEHDALRAHAEVELGIDPDQLTDPWHAAGASFLAFTVGALLPLLAIVLPAGRASGVDHGGGGGRGAGAVRVEQRAAGGCAGGAGGGAECGGWGGGDGGDVWGGGVVGGGGGLRGWGLLPRAAGLPPRDGLRGASPLGVSP